MFFTVAILFLFGIFWNTGVQAQFGLEYGATQTILPKQDIRVTIFRIIEVLLGIVGIIFLSIVLYGGYIYMTSAGEQDAVTRAKRILRNAVIGLAIILAAFGITEFVLRRLSEATGIFSSPTKPITTQSVILGGLGNGPIESHYPGRDQTGVPRNTMIAVTFRESIYPGNFVDEWNDKDGSKTLSAGDQVKTYTHKTDGTYALSGNEYEWNDDGSGFQIPANEYLGLNTDEIRIFPRDNIGALLGANFVKVGWNIDLRTFTFWPVTPIGSPSEEIWYQVELGNEIIKEGGDKAFSGIVGAVGYEWDFQVSTVIDTTPPHIDFLNTYQVFPEVKANPSKEDAEFANVIVQVRFSEPLNPLTASGVFSFRDQNQTQGEVADIAGASFRNIEVQFIDPADGKIKYIAGEFTLSDQYKTIEFRAKSQCGINACGEIIYCLPRNQLEALLYQVFMYSPYLDSTLPQEDGDYYALTDASGFGNGISDMSMNAFDGNRNGKSDGGSQTVSPRPELSSASMLESHQDAFNLNEDVEGQTQTNRGDDAWWKFYIQYGLEISSPNIEAVIPFPDEQGVNRDVVLQTNWDRRMSTRTLKAGKTVLLPPPEGSSWRQNFWLDSFNEDENGTTKTRLQIFHDVFPDPSVEPNYQATVFVPEITSGVQDIYQNCYSACAANESDLLATGQLAKVEVFTITPENVEPVKSFFITPFHDTLLGEEFYRTKFSSSPLAEAFHSRFFVYELESSDVNGDGIPDSPSRTSLGIVHHPNTASDNSSKGRAQLLVSAPPEAYMSVEDDNAASADTYLDTVSGKEISEDENGWTKSRMSWEWSDDSDGLMIEIPLSSWQIELIPEDWEKIVSWEAISSASNGTDLGSAIPVETYDWSNPLVKYKVRISYPAEK